MRPKTLEVLLLLLRRAGGVVSKEELLATVWDGSAVSEYVLTTCISELRAALGEEPKRPQYLKTVHRYGYQLFADAGVLSDQTVERDSATSTAAAIVGRERELAQIEAAFRRALTGQRQVVFVTGEMGIGKTTLADEFFRLLKRGQDSSSNWAEMDQVPAPIIARGQCIAQFGAGEPYMPICEAIGRLGREANGHVIVDVLRQHAPAWLAQIPGLLPPEQRIELRRELPAETQQHMLRLIADAIEALSERQALVLLLEDLHLSDPATLELLAALAMRRGPTCLLILGTFRTAEEYTGSSPFQSLKQQLLLHRQCEEIALAPLTRDAVDTYLATRFFGLALPSGLGATIHDRTEGNPLFVARLVDQLLEDGILSVNAAAIELTLATIDIASHVPRNLRALIEQRADSLAANERELLETASVAGVHFWSACVAAALGNDREEIERLSFQLSQRHGFLVRGERTDATPDLGARYGFCHALYQQVLYERIDVTRRQRLHAAIGSALRTAWGGRAAEISAELAFHFDRGGNPASAIDFYHKAATAAERQGANREAVSYLDRALALLERGDGGPERSLRQLDLLMTRGPAVLATAGYGSVEVLDNYQRALDLARQVDDSIRQMGCLVALSICEQTRGNLREGEQLAHELIRVAERLHLPAPFVAQLHNPLSQVRMYQGAVEESLALSDAAVAAMEVIPMPSTPPDSRPALWADPSVMLHCQRAAASFSLGRLAQAGAAVDEALRIARDLRHPFNLAYASCWAALYEDAMGQWESAARIAQQAIDTAHTYDFPFWEGIAQIIGGHAIARRGDPAGGLTMLHPGIDLWHGTGGRLAAGMNFNLLGDACLAANDIAGAQAALLEAETHAERTGEMVAIAETYRLQAECQRRSGAAAEDVERMLRQAIAIAQQQRTKLWELRATLAVHQLRQSRDSRHELQTICAAFDHEPEARSVTEARLALI